MSAKCVLGAPFFVLCSVFAFSSTIAQSFGAWAGEDDSLSTSSSSTSLKKSEIPGEIEKKNIDDEITNARLRAESGAKKKYSFRSDMVYYGSTIEKPLAASRPNFTGATSNDPDTLMTGNIGMKYRATDHSNFSLLTGLQVRRPFGGDLEAGGNKLEVSNPTVTYNYVARVGGIQSISTVSVDYGTSGDRLARQWLSNFMLEEEVMYQLAGGWELGGALELNANYYGSAPGLSNLNYEFGLYPVVEYAFNDRYSFRTVFRYNTIQSSRQSPNTFSSTYGSQSLGVGIAVTRDIYLYPNLQFAPQNLRADVTNWGLGTYINL